MYKTYYTKKQAFLGIIHAYIKMHFCGSGEFIKMQFYGSGELNTWNKTRREFLFMRKLCWYFICLLVWHWQIVYEFQLWFEIWYPRTNEVILESLIHHMYSVFLLILFKTPWTSLTLIMFYKISFYIHVYNSNDFICVCTCV